ncbi:MAG: hypothetical protein M1837_006800 [Sclerophora amabilis]|nr:MAG: hypothetical protein M1837_006800 [Sclerophora amabilis]
MIVDDIRLLMGKFLQADIPICIVGELALNYYNAPRVVHDLELCVPANDLEKATAMFNSEKDLLEPAVDSEYSVYTEYKRGFPRFRFCREQDFHIVLFSDQFCHLEPLSENIVSYEEHQGTAEYSHEIFDTVSASEVASLPMPRFPPFFTGLCRTYTETKEVMAAIAAELLVDGMNLDERWCLAHFPPSQSDALKFALTLIEGKSSRISDFSPNEVTCFIASREEAQRLLKIPGYV